jgi:ferrochelatase
MADKKRAIIFFNLGGPDSLDAVKPFLFNLFNDKAIIGLPQPFRTLLAKFISSKREKTAQEIYAQMGGRSPIVPLSEAQASALKTALEKQDGVNTEVFICMRYWHPMTEEVVGRVKKYAPDEIILLPLYPQFSTTTSDSSIKLWNEEAKKQGLVVPTRTVGCYPSEEGVIQAHADAIKRVYEKAKKQGNPRLLFSAHGLPEKIVAAGDPYQWQVELTAQSVVNVLGIDGLDWKICYQSRVGPLKWIGPSADVEITKVAEQNRPVVIVPIAFVSEHSETLVELDIEYKEMAVEAGMDAENYFRVPALGDNPQFIKALANICVNISKKPEACVSSHSGVRICPSQFSRCVCKRAVAA